MDFETAKRAGELATRILKAQNTHSRLLRLLKEAAVCTNIEITIKWESIISESGVMEHAPFDEYERKLLIEGMLAYLNFLIQRLESELNEL